MIRIFKCHRLVTGVVSGPKPEIVVGRSTFYPDALDQLSSPIQETGSQDLLGSLEQSKASVISEDVVQTSESKFKGKTTQPSTQICKVVWLVCETLYVVCIYFYSRTHSQSIKPFVLRLATFL